MAKMRGYLTLIGDDFETKHVTEVIGQEPPYVRERNEVLGNGRPFGHCEWGVITEMFDSFDLSPISDTLMNILTCPTHLLRQVAIDCNAQWNILFLVKVTDDDFPAIVFYPEFIKFAAEINAKIGFDTYLLMDSDTEDDAQD